MLSSLLVLAMMAFEEPAMVRVPAPEKADKIDEEVLRQLLTVRRVFVDRLSGGETATQMHDMIVSSLQNAKLFVITENQERADAILRGSAEDLVFTDEHSSSDSVHAQANFGLGGGGSTSRTATRNQRSQYGGMGVGDSESSRSAERKHEAVAAVRLVNKDGDVIWSTTQESMGGKFHGSSADVADRITKKLMEDYDRAKKLPK
ncbi:MAG TPA: hypothetical protein VNH18_32115 [Bryobacteraceae bacterium]|nr:hypothetical protein [Bryobacteraceae bacterium]